ncbi:unnamed protein product [Enterobius vermicularis]|uniref:Transmembrane protein n=1 Tax=Enterobius vermicularis TaxID=51028 RepID=A0A0N4VFC2_ENTVE|nr:unnamed protein product [Enterobius vermicularis]
MALMMETMNRLGVLGRVVGDVRELGPRKSLLSLMFKWVVSAVVCQYLWVCPMLGEYKRRNVSRNMNMFIAKHFHFYTADDGDNDDFGGDGSSCGLLFSIKK